MLRIFKLIIVSIKKTLYVRYKQPAAHQGASTGRNTIFKLLN